MIWIAELQTVKTLLKLDDEMLFPNDTKSYPSVSKDNIIDNYAKRLLDTCCTTYFVTANVRLGNDQTIGDFTFYKKQSTSSNNLNITELFDQFKQLFTSDDDINNDNQHKHDNVNNIDNDLDQRITIIELKRTICSQSNKKASGLDNLPSKIYKHASNELSLSY